MSSLPSRLIRAYHAAVFIELLSPLTQPSHRGILLMRDFDGLSFWDIGVVLGIWWMPKSLRSSRERILGKG
jgi:hypothetical protein